MRPRLAEKGLNMSDGIPAFGCAGGTSKGAFFLERDLPENNLGRDALTVCGSWARPDPRQIDGIGGADPLTSKVAILSPSDADDADVDYLFPAGLCRSSIGL